MLYKSSEFKQVSSISVFCANIDVMSDFVPLVSTITNLTRIIFKLCFQAIASVLIAGIGVVYAFKAVTIASTHDEQLRKDRALCFYHFMHTSFVIDALWIKTFLSHHYLKKSYQESLWHAIPFIGNLRAYDSAHLKSYDGVVQECEQKLNQWVILPKPEQKGPLFSYYYPILIPQHLKDNKTLIIADCKLNPYHIKEIPDDFFKDEDFVKKLLRVLTYYHHGKYAYINDRDFKALMELIIKKAQNHNLMSKVELPFQNFSFTHDKREFLALIQDYPDLVWLLEDKTGCIDRGILSCVGKTCPPIITIMTEDRLKANAKFVKNMLKQEPFLASKISQNTLVAIFYSQVNVLEDDNFLACAKYSPGLKVAMSTYLSKKKVTPKLQIDSKNC